MKTLDEETARRMVLEASDFGPVRPGEVEAVVSRGRRRRRTRRTIRALGAVLLVTVVTAGAFALPGDDGDDAPVAAGGGVVTEGASEVPHGRWVAQPTLGSYIPDGPVSYRGRTVALTSELGVSEATVWMSENGVEWTSSAQLPGLPSKLIADANGFLAATTGPDSVTLWASEDGETWTESEFPFAGAGIVHAASGPTGRLVVAQGNDSDTTAWISGRDGNDWQEVEFDLAERSLAASDSVGNVEPGEPYLDALVGNRHGFVAVVVTMGTNQVPHLWASRDGSVWQASTLPANDRTTLYSTKGAVATDDAIWFATRSTLWRAGPSMEFSEIAVAHDGTISDLAASDHHFAILVSQMAPLVLVTDQFEIKTGGTAVVLDRDTSEVTYEASAGEFRVDMDDGFRLVDLASGNTIVELTEGQAAAAVERAGGPPTDATTTVLNYNGEAFTEITPPQEESGASTILSVVEDVLYLTTSTDSYAQRLP